MRPLFTLTILASLAIGSWSCNAADTTALAKRLHDAAELSSLDDPALKPWHLKLAVQLYDAKGNPSEQGTIEEWWTPENDKRVYDTPSYRATEIKDGKSVYRTTGQPTVPYLLYEARASVVHPAPIVGVEDKSESELQSQVQSFGKVKLDCIMLSTQRKSSSPISPGQVPTFCLEPGMDQLRVSWFDPKVSTRTGIGLFQGRRVGIDGSISISGVRAVSLHVEILDSKGFDSSIWTPGGDLEDRSNDPVWVSAGTGVIKKLKGEPPRYPESAKHNHISGAVMLIATIGTDGHVVDTEVVGSPDHSLSESAVEAVRKWVYTPYVENGVPRKMRTTIAVHYNFGRL